MFNSFYIPTINLFEKNNANCIDNYDFEEFHLLQANISHIGFHERFYSSLLLVLDTPFFNESVQKQKMCSSKKLLPLRSSSPPTTLSNKLKPVRIMRGHLVATLVDLGMTIRFSQDKSTLTKAYPLKK